jgi:hypothetical protein
MQTAHFSNNIPFANPQMNYANPQMIYANPQMNYANPLMNYANSSLIVNSYFNFSDFPYYISNQFFSLKAQV